MSTQTPVAPYQSTQTAVRDGFGPLLRAEFTKFRTVRGWVVGLLVAIAATVLLGMLGPPSLELPPKFWVTTTWSGDVVTMPICAAAPIFGSRAEPTSIQVAPSVES